MFYGWVVVGAAFMVTLVGFGSAYTFGSFVDALQAEFGASRGAVSLVFSLAGFLYFGFGLVSGPLADRHGSRLLAVIGMSLVSLGLVLAAFAQSLEQVCIAYGLGVGLGVGCAYVPAVAAVQRWFSLRRGLASGLAVSGIGLGTLFMPLLATALIAAHGWRTAYLILGVLVAVLGIGAALLLEDDPRRRGLGPDGGPAPAEGQAVPRPGVSVAMAVRSPRFIGLYAACFVCSIGVFIPFVHVVPYAMDHQVAPARAVLLLGAIGIGSTAGRFVLGGVADRVGRDRFLIAAYLGMGASLAIWAVAESLVGLAAFTLLFGLFYGGWVAILPALAADHFGPRHLSSIIGTLYTSVAVGTLVGPTAAGYIFDASGSYFLPILVAIAANVVAALIAIATLRTASPLAATR